MTPRLLVLSMLAWMAAPLAGQAPAPAMIDLATWELVATPATAVDQVLSARDGGVYAVTGSPVSYIASRATYRNYRLHAEWRWPGKPGNSGILVHISSGPKDRQWPVCYQIQMKNTAVGDLLPMAGATFGEPLTTPPDAATPLRARSAPDSERPVGEWNAVDIICRDDTIDVIVNGVTQNRVSRCAVSGGRVGFQLEGTPFELRNVSITPLI